MGDDLYVVEHLSAEGLSCVGDGLHIVVDLDLVLDLHVVAMDVEFDALIDCGDKLHTY